ncbi:MAG: PorV/PorQ family protein [Elusimicrobia bacterium]|nr:PorV/PorQ family protein [Elusimicrobiota bacterium]
MRKLRGLVLAALSLALARPCLAGAGAEPLDFLLLDANARAVGLGGAYTALATDANALLYNPAGLAKVGRHEATFMHNVYMQGIGQEYAAYASPQGWGADLNFLDFGGVQRTTLSSPGGAGLGETGLSDLALGAGYGRSLTESLAVGVGVKYIRETIDDVKAQGFALDAGGLYAVPALSGLTVGLAVQNLGPTVRFDRASENLPLNLRAGAAYGFKVSGHGNVVALDVTKERSQSALVAVGGETRLLEPLALRMGFNTRNDAGIGITAGFGYLFKAGSVDYAIVPMGDLGDAHRISLTLRWE